MRWIVGPGDGDTIGDVLLRAGADRNAVGEGRVFVGRRRVQCANQTAREGDVIEIARPRASSGEPVRILAAVSDLVAVDKPAGMPTIPDHSGSAHALLALTADALGLDASELHATSRLDRDVSGVVVFARTADAARRLVRARAEGNYARRYVAIASAAPSPDRGTWDAPIGRGRDPRLRAASGRDSVPATTHYRACARAPGSNVCACAMLALAPVTGRTHQIRVHAAHGGAPLVGDRAYGGLSRLVLGSGRIVELRRIALHAARVVVPDESGGAFEASAPVPSALARLWSDLGGDEDAWELATSCALR